MIFYFSATGNCEHVAKRIAAATGDELRSVTDCRRRDVYAFDEGCETIGIISPTYSWGLPLVVKEFLERLEVPTPKYLWFVATFGTTPGQTGRFAEEILKRRGLMLNAKFSVKMPDTWTPIFDLSDAEKVGRINAAAEGEIDFVIGKLKSRASGDFMKRKIPYPVAKLGYGFEYDLMRQTKRLSAGDSCVGCGLCAKNCPVGAIELRDKRPVWVKERCVMCLSCLHRCPKFAIQYGKNTKKHGQYTHP